MAGGRLATWFVEFKQLGKAQVAGDIDDIGRRLQAQEAPATKAGRLIADGLTAPLRGALAVTGAVARGVGLTGLVVASPLIAAGQVVTGFARQLLGPLGDALRRTVAGLQEVGRAASGPFLLAAGAIGSFVRAGLAGTQEGGALAVQFRMLSQEIAALFLGPINSLIDGIGRLTDWFRSLDGSTQRTIGTTITLGVGLLGVAAVLPRLIAGVQMFGSVLGVLSAHPIIAIVAAFVALLMRSEEGRGILAGLGRAFAGIGNVIEKIAGLLGNLVNVLANVAERIAAGFQRAGESIGDVISNIDERFLGGTLGRVWDRVRTFWNDLTSPTTGGILGGGTRAREDRQNVAAQGTGPQDVRSFFSRFQAAANQTDYARESRDLLRDIRDRLPANPDRPEELPPPAPVD